MRLSGRHQIAELIVIVGLKSSSLLLMAYSLIALTLHGGLVSVGHYAAVTAITAPIGMFCSFRYVESLSLSDSPKSTLSTLISVALCCYFLILPLLCVVLYYQIGAAWFVVFLLLYKPLEIFNDMLSAYLVCVRDKKKAFFSIAYKLIAMVILSSVAIFFDVASAELVISASLFLSFAVVFFFYDLRIILRNQVLIRRKLGEIIAFFRENFSLGLVNLIISFNSSIPRYYLTYVGDMASLGLFSLTYQVSATIVNVLQYAVSIKTAALSRYLYSRSRVLVALLIASLVGLLFIFWRGSSIFGFAPTSARSIYDTLIYSSPIIIIMFIYLMFRGVLISLTIARGGGNSLVAVISMSMAASILVLGVLHVFGFTSSSLEVSFMFVVLSSFFSSSMFIGRVFARNDVLY